MKRVPRLNVGRNANSLTNRTSFNRKGAEMDQLLEALQQQSSRHLVPSIFRNDAEYRLFRIGRLVHQFQIMTLLKAGLLCKRISSIDSHFCVGLGRERPVGAVAPSSSSSTSATVRQQTNPNRLWQAAMLTLDAAAVEAPAHLDRLAGDVRAHQTDTPQLRGRNATCPLTPIFRNCDSKNRETADRNSGEPTSRAPSASSDALGGECERVHSVRIHEDYGEC